MKKIYFIFKKNHILIKYSLIYILLASLVNLCTETIMDTYTYETIPILLLLIAQIVYTCTVEGIYTFFFWLKVYKSYDLYASPKKLKHIIYILIVIFLFSLVCVFIMTTPPRFTQSWMLTFLMFYLKQTFSFMLLYMYKFMTKKTR